MFNSYGLSPKPLGHTRITSGTKSSIDWLYTNPLASKLTKNLKNENISISDHNIIKFELKNIRNKNQIITKDKLSIDKKGSIEFSKQINTLNGNLGDFSFEDYLIKVDELVSLNFKQIKDRVIICKNENSNFIVSKKFIKMSKRRDKLYKIARQTGNNSDMVKYKKCKKYCKKQIIIDKKTYFSKLLNRSNDITKRWNIIGKFINNKVSFDTNNIKCLKYENISYTTQEEISNVFNNAFLGVINSYIGNNGRSFTQDVWISSQDAFEFKTINQNDLYKAIHDSKPSSNIKANNSIRPQIWDKFKHLFICALLYYVNLMISKCQFPSSLKISKVIPIFKKDSQLDPLNYRPVSILPFFSKIFERVLYSQINNFITKNKLLSDMQFGFKKNCGTETALLYIIDEIIKNIAKKYIIVLVFLDFRKAFDSINHINLVNKLHKKFGFSKDACKLILSYLTDRFQYVLVNGASSTTDKIQHGVPQGSILGPILFNMCIDDMKEIIECLLFQFADDATTLASGLDECTIINKLNRDMNKITSYCNENQLFLNETKCKVMVINGNKDKFLNKIFLNNIALEVVDEYKYLGYVIDSKLSFKTQVSKISQRIVACNSIMGRCRYFLDRSTLFTIYNSLVVPIILYNKTIIIKCNKTMKNKLQINLNNSESIIYNCFIRECSRNKFNIEKFTEFYILLFIHKYLYMDTPYFNDSLVLSNERLNNLRRPICGNKKICEKSIKFFAPQLWNSQNAAIKKELNFNKFKKLLFLEFDM